MVLERHIARVPFPGDLHHNELWGMDAGVYRSLSGTFELATGVSEPATTTLVFAGLAALIGEAGRGRRQRRGTQAVATALRA